MELLEDAGNISEHEPREFEETSQKASEEMVELVNIFTEEQMNRYESYRRSSLPKSVLKRIFQSFTGTVLNSNGVIVLAAVGKLFIGELVELAREVADNHGLSDLEPVQPLQLKEAFRHMLLDGKVLHNRNVDMFRNQRL